MHCTLISTSLSTRSSPGNCIYSVDLIMGFLIGILIRCGAKTLVMTGMPLLTGAPAVTALQAECYASKLQVGSLWHGIM